MTAKKHAGTEKKSGKDGRFSKGWKPGPGRPKGVPNKLTQTIRAVFEDAFAELQDDPDANLTSWARENPTEFYKLSGKLIPTQMHLTGKLTLAELVTEAAAKKNAAGG